jgi:hypothetical protein
MTKLSMLVLGFALFVGHTTHANPSHAPIKEPLQVKNIFIPEVGYDDNDNIEFVIDGVLKNACYQLGSSSIKISGRNIFIEIEATRDGNTYCDMADELLPDAVRAPIPFYKTLELGVLKAGSYNIVYSNQEVAISRTFAVEVASSPRQDSLSYAPVDNAWMSSLVNIGETAVLNLSGMLTSSCMHLREKPLLTYLDDVIVVQPLVKVDLTSKCLMYLRPFAMKVEIPNLNKGRYLIHVRSMNGQSVNKVFSVCATDNTNGACAAIDRTAL